MKIFKSCWENFQIGAREPRLRSRYRVAGVGVCSFRRRGVCVPGLSATRAPFFRERGAGIPVACQSFWDEKRGSEIVNNLPPEGPKKRQKTAFCNRLFSRHNLLTKFYSSSYQILIKFYFSRRWSDFVNNFFRRWFRAALLWMVFLMVRLSGSRVLRLGVSGVGHRTVWRRAKC